MLGFAETPAGSPDPAHNDEDDDAAEPNGASASDIVTISPAESIFVDPSKHVAIATLRYDVHAPIRPRMGAQLLTSSIYDLMLDRLVEFATRDGGAGGSASELASLGLRVLDHMRALQVRPSAHARMSLLKLLASCRPQRWSAALPVWQDGLDEYLSGRGPKASKVFKPSISGMAMAAYTKLMLKSLEAGGQPALALQVFRTMQAAAKSVAKPASALLHDEFSLDNECVALVLNAISMQPTAALLEEADDLFRDALQAHMASQAPTPLPSALFTPLIIAHATAGHLDRAMGLLRLQSRQRLGSLQDQPAIASVASKHDDRVPSPVAFIHVIAAAMTQGADDLATALWEQLHNAYPGPLDGQQASASLLASNSDSIPFALRTPPASGEFDDPIAASLQFHFSPLALKQFQAARSYLLLIRQRATAARPVLARDIEVVLGDFAMMGQSYLVLALLRDVRGLVPIPSRDRIRRGAASSAASAAASASAAEIPTEVANLFLQSCVSTMPTPQLAQAELIPRWLRAQGLRPNARTYLVLHQLYATQGLWDRSLALRETMDEVGEPLTLKQMEAMLIATARACMVSPEGKQEDRALGTLPPGCLHPTAFAALSSLAAPHSQALEAWSAAQSLFAQFYASLITPAMHRVLLCAALAARQYAAALRIFQDQYNADLGRQHALEDGVRSSQSSENNARSCYFRSQMSTELLNHLLLAARATNNPFMAAQIYSLMQSRDGFAVPSPRQPSASSSAAAELAAQFAPIPQLRANQSSNADAASATGSFSAQSADVEWIHSPTDPDVISYWILVGWVDELQERVFRAPAPSAPAQAASSSAPDAAGSRGRKSRQAETTPASASPPPVPEVQSSTAWLPTQPTRHEGRLRGAMWTPLTLHDESGNASVSPAMLTSVMQFCLDVEQYSHVVLAAPSPDTAAAPVWPNAAEASARSSGPFRVNLLGLGGDSALSLLRASAVLHLTMRHLSSLYLEKGAVHELVVVHSAPNGVNRVGRAAAASSSPALDDSVLHAPIRSGRGVSESEIQEAMLSFLESKRKPSSASSVPNGFRVDLPAWAKEALPPPAPLLRASPALWRRSAVWPSIDLSSSSSSSAPQSLPALAQSILEQYQLQVSVGAEELSVSKQQMQSWMMGR